MADKAALEKRAYHIDERMMHDAISKRGGGNDAVFGTFQFNFNIAACLECLALKLMLQM